MEKKERGEIKKNNLMTLLSKCHIKIPSKIQKLMVEIGQ
jgi:hypothetical protein